MTPLTTQMALSTIQSEKPGCLASRAVAFPPLDKASSVCGPAHYLSQTDTGFVLVQRQGNRWRQQVWGEVLWVWPVFEGRDSRGHILSCISRKQRKAGRESSSFKEKHCCLTSLGRKFEELHPKLRAGWRGASEVWAYIVQGGQFNQLIFIKHPHAHGAYSLPFPHAEASTGLF